MKLLFVLLILVALVCGKTTLQKRSALTEDVVINIDYHGTCADFEEDLGTFRVSSFLTDSCLPITTAAGFDDLNDLHADYTCTNVAHGRSVVRIVEIFQIHGTPITDYIVSFVPSNPFKATTAVDGVEVNYFRRPSCNREEDYCTLGVFSVTKCTDNSITRFKGKVNNKDRIYLLPSTKTARTCKNAAGVCCAYINTQPAGLCPYTAPADLIVDSNGKGYHHNGDYNQEPHQFPWNHFGNYKNKKATEEKPAQIKKHVEAPKMPTFQVIPVFPKEEMDKDKIVMLDKEDIEEEAEKEVEERTSEKKVHKKPAQKPVVPVEESDEENEPEPSVRDFFTLGNH